MKIRVSEIGSSYNINYNEGDLGFFKETKECSPDSMDINGQVQVDLNIAGLKDKYDIKGRIKGAMVLCCSRCLESFPNPFDRNFSLTLKEESSEDLSDVHEIELTDEDLKVEFFKGDEIDITKIVQEQVVLLCPIKPLCSEECKGLCPNCGANLNEEECGCRPDTTDSPFSVLKDLDI